MVSFDYTSYRLGKRSADRLVRALRRVMCGDEKQPCDELTELAPYLMGVEDCDELDEMLDVYFAWESLRWAYTPRGRPPSVKKRMVKRALCREGLPVDEEFLRELAPPEHSEAEEIEEEVE